jgi:hypothetical protein
VAESLAEHDRIGGLDPVDDAPKVDVKNPIPIVHLVVPRLTRDANACVIEQVIQTPMTAHDGFDHPVYCGAIRDIDFGDRRLSGPRADGAGDSLGAFGLQVGDHDLRPTPGQSCAQSLAYSGGTAGDNRDCAIEGPKRLVRLHPIYPSSRLPAQFSSTWLPL